LKIGLSYDLKDSIEKDGRLAVEDALEEYDSLETIDAIAVALEALGHETLKLGGGNEFLRRIQDVSVDFVFNIAEGRGIFRSREAQVPSVLEMRGIPYSGSDPACMCLCHDKPLAKRLVASAGIITPRWRLISSHAELEASDWNGFPLPAFLKPAYEGSSKGVRIASRVENVTGLKDSAAKLLETYLQPVLVEEFIDGEEVTVGLIGNVSSRIVGIMRVGKTSLAIFNLLGCRDFARLDMRISGQGEPYFLEINPLPGLNPRTSDYPIMAKLMGMSYNSLIAAIFTSAIERYPELK
jgi:D-alanine-D-alanine ligase